MTIRQTLGRPSDGDCLPVGELHRQHNLLPIAVGILFGLTLVARISAIAQEPADNAQPQQKQVGKLIRIEAPITNVTTTSAIRMAKTAISEATKNGERPVLIFEIHPGKASFGAAMDLATEILKLNGATTVAFVPPSADGQPQVLRGHAVLVALACDMIVMPPTAKIGEAGADEEHIADHIRSGYAHVANARRTVPEDLVLGMLDPAIEVYEVESELTREFVRGDRLAEVEKQKTVVVRRPPLIPKGQAGLFTGEEAKRLGIARHLAEDRQGVARALSLPIEAVVEDPSLDGGWRPVEVRITKELTDKYVAQVRRKIEEQIDRHNRNLIILTIDSPGGAAEDAVALAKYLSELNSSRWRTVAHIPQEARGDAAFLALACDRIVMRPGATIGGALAIGDAPRDADEENPDRRSARESITNEIQQIARAKGRNYSLAVALFDGDLTVYRYTRKSDGVVNYFSQAEAQSQPDPNQWEQGEQITEPDKPLVLDGVKAHRYGLATELVNSDADLRALFSITDELPQIEPDWVDTLVDALTQPWVLFLLMMIGFSAFYAEMQHPGTGVGGFVATICFLLFFWGTYLGGTADWLEILLFIVGVVFILLEVFVLPGFGIFGVGGGLMIAASLVLALQTFSGLSSAADYIKSLRGSLLMVVGAGAAVTGVIAALRYYLPRRPKLNQGLVLTPPGEEEGETQPGEAGPYDHFLHSRGKVLTRLTPAGKIRIGDQHVDVVSEGEWIDRGAEVVVVQVQGNRIVVRPAERGSA